MFTDSPWLLSYRYICLPADLRCVFIRTKCMLALKLSWILV